MPYVERSKGLPSLELIQDSCTIAISIALREQPFGSYLEFQIVLNLTPLSEGPHLACGPSYCYGCQLSGSHIRQELGLPQSLHWTATVTLVEGGVSVLLTPTSV